MQQYARAREVQAGQGLFPKISHISNISNKNMTISRFSGIFSFALLARIPVGKSLVSANLQPDTTMTRVQSVPPVYCLSGWRMLPVRRPACGLNPVPSMNYGTLLGYDAPKPYHLCTTFPSGGCSRQPRGRFRTFLTISDFSNKNMTFWRFRMFLSLVGKE